MRPICWRRPPAVGPAWQHGPVAAAPPAPTSRLRVVVGEEELLRERAVSAVRVAVRDLHPDVEEHELVAAGLPLGDLAEVLSPSLFGGHRLVVVQGDSMRDYDLHEGDRLLVRTQDVARSASA